MSQDATRPVHPNSRTMQSTADSALVCEHGNVGRGCGFVVTCRARILTLGSGSCRLDTPAAPTGDPSHARGAVAGCVSTACQLFTVTLHLVSIFNKHCVILASNQSSTHVRRCLRSWLCDAPDTQARARGSAVQGRRVNDFTVVPW